MGFIDFVKNAGAKLFGKSEDDAPKPTVKTATAPSPAEIAALKARALKRAVEGFGIPVEGLSVALNDDVATVRGKVKTQADREKLVLAVGNTHGIARVDDQLEVTVSEPAATFYTVVAGDTLSKIAKQHYGNAMKYPVIFEANKPMLTHPDKIYPGQVLRIPPASP